MIINYFILYNYYSILNKYLNYEIITKKNILLLDELKKFRKEYEANK